MRDPGSFACKYPISASSSFFEKNRVFILFIASDDYSPNYKDILKGQRNYIQVFVNSRLSSPPATGAPSLKPTSSLVKNIDFLRRLEQHIRTDMHYKC